MALLADVIAFNATFFPMHWTGLQAAAAHRRLRAEVEGWNLFMSISAFVLGAAMLIFLYNMIHGWMRGPKAAGEPWRAHSIEWQVSSPPPLFNFDEIPQVVGGPYEYGVPGARHAVWSEDGAAAAAGGGRRGGEEEEVRR